MNKSRLSVSIGLASLATLPVTAQEQRDKELPERPNVIVLLADDIGWGDLSPYGTSGVETPAVEELAQRGTRFTDAHCVAATSTPSRRPYLIRLRFANSFFSRNRNMKCFAQAASYPSRKKSEVLGNSLLSLLREYVSASYS